MYRTWQKAWHGEFVAGEIAVAWTVVGGIRPGSSGQAGGGNGQTML